MGGELTLKVKKVRSSYDFVRPSYDISNDLTMILGENEYLHICGENDWAFLALELLEPINVAAREIVELVHRKKSETDIKAVMLGRNDKRIMDVYFGGKDKCQRICDLPIITTDNLNEVTFLIEEVDEIPFS